MNRRGQTTVFIIIAIIIVAAVVGYLIFKDRLSISKLPSDMQPIYTSFLSCIEEYTLSGAAVLEGQGGYIDLPEFEAGSEYMPFSSQLNFLGTSIPYWYYVSGNNVEGEQVPSKRKMEKDLQNFIDEKISSCSFETYYDAGYAIDLGEPKARADINDNSIGITLRMDMTIEKGNKTAVVKTHNVKVDSDLGLLYESAVEVYDEEQKNLFLENYALDIINFYAPVDGVEFSCASKVWDVYSIFDDLQKAVEANLAVVGIEGDSDNYFVLENLDRKISDDVHVDFMASSNWPVTFEVNPSEGALLVANPVGGEAGLGSLGFCYVAYHFVYDFKYPVLVQLRSEITGEIFQFPFAVIIEGSNPRESLSGESSVLEAPEICENANTEFSITAVDSNSAPVDADISFECFSQTCHIGNTEGGVLEGLLPQCVNGYVIASADGFEDSAVQVSTVNSGSLTINMERLYNVDLVLELDSVPYSGEAVITFGDSTGNSKTVLYPGQDQVSLSAGTYDISVSIYDDVSLELGSSTQEFCTEVPRKIVGVLGFTKEECYEVEVPEQLISKALSGGGVATYDFSEGDLSSSYKIVLNAEEFPEPDSLIQIQENHVLFENKILGVGLR